MSRVKNYLAEQTECEGCGERAELSVWREWESGWEGSVCSSQCGWRAVDNWIQREESRL